MKAKTEPAGVLPVSMGDTPRYVVLTIAAALGVAAWEALGRPTWSVRWIIPVELPGGDVRPEYLYAQSGIPCYLRPKVAGTPPYEAAGVELGYSCPTGEEWHPATVDQVRGMSEARTLVKDMADQGGRYCTWDRSLNDRTHQHYLTDGEELRLTRQPVYPGQDAERAAMVLDPACDVTPDQEPVRKGKRSKASGRPDHYKKRAEVPRS